MFFIDLQYEKKLGVSGLKADRFDAAKFMEYSGNFHEPLTSHFLMELKKLPESGVFKVTSEESRPDLVAYKIYRQTQLWWILMYYNGLQNTSDIKASVVLRYPSLSSLEKIYYTLPGLASK